MFTIIRMDVCVPVVVLCCDVLYCTVLYCVVLRCSSGVSRRWHGGAGTVHKAGHGDADLQSEGRGEQNRKRWRARKGGRENVRGVMMRKGWRVVSRVVMKRPFVYFARFFFPVFVSPPPHPHARPYTHFFPDCDVLGLCVRTTPPGDGGAAQVFGRVLDGQSEASGD